MKTNRANSKRVKAVAEAEKAWRLFRWLSFGFLGAAMLSWFALSGFIRWPLSATERADLHSYEAIRTALAHDDLRGAKSAAALLAQRPDTRRCFAVAAKAIADSESLDGARRGFVNFSQTAVDLTQHRFGFFIMHCATVGCPEPCVNCPMGSFGPWVQVTKDVENPYMGLHHTKCGIVDASM